MKRMIMVMSLVALILIGLADVSAQAQMGGQMPMMGQTGQQDQPAGQPPMMGGGMMGQGMMGMPMMGTECPMMSGGMGMMSMMSHMMGGHMAPHGMGMGMARMMGSGRMDPKAMGQMLQLRGEILKAVGEVMVKHRKAMEEAK